MPFPLADAQTMVTGVATQAALGVYRDYLLVIALFINATKGISALQVSRDVGISYKTAFVILHKLREAIESSREDMRVGGEVEIDGAYYGGHARPPNAGWQGKRGPYKGRKQCVLTLVGRGGGTVPAVVEAETTEAVLTAVDRHLAAGSAVYADEHAAYDALHAYYETYRINHRWRYADGHISTNAAESFHSRMRRAEIGQNHHISGRYLLRYAHEMAYRTDRRRVANGPMFTERAGLTVTHPMSRQWKGYWQRRA